jgi:uncharacterized phage-like protein YoqJ
MNLTVTGHRPPKIGGYVQTDPLRVAVKRAMMEIVEKIKPDFGITGMALGVDQDFADICVALDIPFIAAVPFKGQENAWPEESRDNYEELLSLAHKVEIVSPGGYGAWKMQKRNEWMCYQAHEILAVWDGSDGGTANCVAFAEKLKLPIHRINPKDLRGTKT